MTFSAIPKMAAECPVCRGKAFGPGPTGRVGRQGQLPCCLECGSLERHRIVASVLNQSGESVRLYREPTLIVGPDVPTKLANHFQASSRMPIDKRGVLDGSKLDQRSEFELVLGVQVLNRVRSVETALADMARRVSASGLLYLAYASPMHRKHSEDWGTGEPRTNGDYRILGTDFEAKLLVALSKFQLMVALVADPVTKEPDLVYLASRDPEWARRVMAAAQANPHKMMVAQMGNEYERQSDQLVASQDLLRKATHTPPLLATVTPDKSPSVALRRSTQPALGQSRGAGPARVLVSATASKGQSAESKLLAEPAIRRDKGDRPVAAKLVSELVYGANGKALAKPETEESTELTREIEFDVRPFYIPQVRYAVNCHPSAKSIDRELQLQYWDRKKAIIGVPPPGFLGAGGVYVKHGEMPVTSAAAQDAAPLVPSYGAVRGRLKITIKAKDPISFSIEPTLDHTQVCDLAVGSATLPAVGRSQNSGRSNVIIYSASSGPFRPDVLRLRPHYLSECFARWGYDVRYFPLSSEISEAQVAPGLRQFRRSDYFAYMQEILRQDDAPGVFVCSSLCNAETMLLLDRIKDRGWKVLYEVRDDPEGMKGDSGKFGTWYNTHLERRLCVLADAVIVVSSPLRDRAIAFGAREDKVFVYPNGIEDDMRFYASNNWSADAVASRRKERTVVGYFGHMFSGRFDAEAVGRAARHMPDVKFELIGPGLENPKRLDLPNVQLYGQQTVDEYFRISKAWDIGMLPFKSNRITFSIDPIKYYQYIAAGVKVVNSDVYVLRGAPMTHLYDAEKSLTSVLRNTLKREITVSDGKQLIDYLATQTWEARAEATLAALELPQYAKDLA